MKNPELVIMAAGMGSRFGGLKQMEPVGKNNEVLLDFSVYDAVKAGFTKVVFVIKHAIENPDKLSTAEKHASDINGDGKVSALDVRLALQLASS